MELLKSIIRVGLHHAGGLSLVRQMHPGIRILTYHRFPLDRLGVLDQQCRHLRRHYRPVSMSEVADSLLTGKALPRNAVAITVDDGYRDFLECAAPVFRSYEIPAIVYLVTDFLDGKLWLWWDKIEFALRHTAVREITGAGRVFPLVSPAQRTAAFDCVTHHAKQLSNQGRLQFVEELIAQLQVPVPGAPPAEYAPMEWREVRQLCGQGFEFGSHTVTHPILSRLATLQEIERETHGSRDRIAQELGQPLRHFCYPNGQPEDFNDAVMESVSRAGFSTAVTTIPGLNRRVKSPLLLERRSVDLTLTSDYFAETVAGMHPEINLRYH